MSNYGESGGTTDNGSRKTAAPSNSGKIDDTVVDGVVLPPDE